jgi:hypothetical protein
MGFREKKMKTSTKLRLLGAAIIIFNLWLIGHFNISGLPVLLLTLGVAIGFEVWLVRPAIKAEKANEELI